jgi:acetylornithine deacetylase
MEPEAVKAVAGAVDRLFDDLVATLQGVVRIPSLTGEEGAAQQFMRKQYEALGLEVHSLVADRAVLKNHPAYCDNGMSYDGRPNIIGIQRGDPGKNSMILNGHVDVVSPEPVGQWTHDPWGGEVVGNRLYGRGAWDMKGGLIANLFALKALNQAGLKPKGTVMLQSVIEEEDGGGPGALACLVAGHTGDGMIVSEISHVPVTVALAGIMRCLVKVKGRSSHAAQSHLGVNAIGKILPIYQALERLDAKRKAEVRFPLFEEHGGPACHLVIGTLHAGDWISTVPGLAELGCRVGFIPGEKSEDIQKLVEDTVRNAAAADPWLRENPPEVQWLPFRTDPYFQDPEHPFVKRVISSAQAIMGDQIAIKPRGGAWSEDTRFAQYFGFPALSIGPTGERAHGLDEYVNLESLRSITKAIAAATFDWCAQPKESKSN